jgi:tetratricopeptide (TPR) repeat protein
VHFRHGRYAEARTDWQRRLEVAPENAEAHNDLAWLLATCPEVTFRDAGRAVALATRAVELAPQHSGWWNTLGVAQYRAGNWQAAIESLNKSEMLAPDQFLSFNALFLAMAHQQLGETQAAWKYYDQAMVWRDQHTPADDELQRFRGEATELLGPRVQPVE